MIRKQPWLSRNRYSISDKSLKRTRVSRQFLQRRESGNSKGMSREKGRREFAWVSCHLYDGCEGTPYHTVPSEVNVLRFISDLLQVAVSRPQVKS